jgi:hypothetical protein
MVFLLTTLITNEIIAQVVQLFIKYDLQDETMEEDGTREEEDNVAMHSSKVEPCF